LSVSRDFFDGLFVGQCDIWDFTFRGGSMRHFLVHDHRDNVGVVVRDVKSGEKLAGASTDNGDGLRLTARQEIPLGHKIALKDLKRGDTVIKYGEDIGKVVADIRAGEHVHVHNLKTKRW
jgi:(2R)-sulfolactate sulfo-lyase subunit alpha